MPAAGGHPAGASRRAGRRSPGPSWGSRSTPGGAAGRRRPRARGSGRTRVTPHGSGGHAVGQRLGDRGPCHQRWLLRGGATPSRAGPGGPRARQASRDRLGMSLVRWPSRPRGARARRGSTGRQGGLPAGGDGVGARGEHSARTPTPPPPPCCGLMTAAAAPAWQVGTPLVAPPWEGVQRACPRDHQRDSAGLVPQRLACGHPDQRGDMVSRCLEGGEGPQRVAMRGQSSLGLRGATVDGEPGVSPVRPRRHAGVISRPMGRTVPAR